MATARGGATLRAPRHVPTCLSNVKQLGSVTMQHVQDDNETYCTIGPNCADQSCWCRWFHIGHHQEREGKVNT
jgi:hypothetical protein